MSQFSDKSDFADTCLMHYSPNRVFYADLTVDKIPLKLSSPKDLIPYYGHGICAMSSSKDDGKMSISLTKESFADMRDEERIQIRIDDYVYLARKAKRKKAEVDFKEFAQMSSLYVANKTEPFTACIFDKCKNIEKLLLKYWMPRTWTYDEIENKTEKNLFNLSIIHTNFSNVHTAASNRYRENLLKYAAPFFGQWYVDFDSQKAFCDNDIRNSKLIDIKTKVLEYHKMCEKYGGK